MNNITLRQYYAGCAFNRIFMSGLHLKSEMPEDYLMELCFQWADRMIAWEIKDNCKLEARYKAEAEGQSPQPPHAGTYRIRNFPDD